MTAPGRWPSLRRDSVIWLLGIGFAVNELVVEPKIRPEALVFITLLLGLPGGLAANQYAKRIIAAVATEAATPDDPGDEA